MSAKNSNKRSNSDLDTNNNNKLQKLNETKLYSTVINQKVVKQLKKEVLEIIFNCPIDNIPIHKQQNLPGPMPWAITKNQLNLLFIEEYWVAEKSDGVRKLLYISYDTKEVWAGTSSLATLVCDAIIILTNCYFYLLFIIGLFN
jgi:hypothetical protein